MTRTLSRLLSRSLPHVLLASCLVPLSAHAEQWVPPTPEELSMTSQAQVPGASAVCLFREEIYEDNLHMFSVYKRIKVLNEGGKKYGDVELQYAAGTAVRFNINEIVGRTIHSDGTVIPFTGKPYEKLIEKGRGYKAMAKVFSMPNVEVGSIIEYRYKLRYDDSYYVPPQWYVQTELFTRKAHYLWKPTDKQLTNERGQLTSGISWTPLLPPDAKVVETRLSASSVNGSEQRLLDLAMHDIPPSPEEEYMPPISSFTYRVLFYYSPYRNSDEFWKNEVKFWAKTQDRFIGPGPAVSSAVKDLTLPTDSDDQKLRKLYAAVQKLENTRFTRRRTENEDKSEGLGQVKTTDDIWLRKRGTDDQLAQLFVAMARSAGFKAYLVAVTSRDKDLFFPGFLSLSQLNDDLAVVNVGGKEVFFDPGSRFCPYGHLAWKHDQSGGLRETDGGAALVYTPPESYTASRIQRVANLTLDKQGIASGTVKMTYTGAPALDWRQTSLEGDEESLRHDLRASMEELLPSGMEIRVSSIEKLTDYEQPLTVVFDVKGSLGSATGKRLLLPGDLFEANTRPAFPHEKRDIAVYFHYPHLVQDAVRINFPQDFKIESLPIEAKLQFQQLAVYSLTAEAAPANVTVRKNYVLGTVVFPPKSYPELRTFYSGMQAKDQQTVVLKIQPLEEKAGTAAN